MGNEASSEGAAVELAEGGKAGLASSPPKKKNKKPGAKPPGKKKKKERSKSKQQKDGAGASKEGSFDHLSDKWLSFKVAEVTGNMEPPGGYAAGDVVYSLINFTDATGDIEPGSKGTVQGNSQKPSEIAVHFESGCKASMSLSQISRQNPLLEDKSKYGLLRTPSVELPGGFAVGDVVYSLISFTDATGDIEPGSKGAVRGPSTRPTAVAVFFESGCKANMSLSQISKQPLLSSLSQISGTSL